MRNHNNLGGAAAIIRLLRAYWGISQRELGGAAQIHPQRLWRIENDLASPSQDEMVRLALVLMAGDRATR